MGEPVRLQKLLAQAGFGSRRSCETFIVEGRVTVDGSVVRQLGSKADPETQVVEFDGQKVAGPGKRSKSVRESEQKVYYALNKPRGVLCTNEDPSNRPLAIQLIPEKRRIYCVGRLDIDTEGLILLTNDGELTNQLTHPRYGVEKTYVAKVDGQVAPGQINKLETGVHLAEGKTQGARVRVRRAGENASNVEMTISEGMNRQVRRMLARVELRCRVLRRVAIGPIRLEDMPLGAHRRLTTEEIARLRAAITFARKNAGLSENEPDPERGEEIPRERRSSRVDRKRDSYKETVSRIDEEDDWDAELAATPHTTHKSYSSHVPTAQSESEQSDDDLADDLEADEIAEAARTAKAAASTAPAPGTEADANEADDEDDELVTAQAAKTPEPKGAEDLKSLTAELSDDDLDEDGEDEVAALKAAQTRDRGVSEDDEISDEELADAESSEGVEDLDEDDEEEEEDVEELEAASDEDDEGEAEGDGEADTTAGAKRGKRNAERGHSVRDRGPNAAPTLDEERPAKKPYEKRTGQSSSGNRRFESGGRGAGGGGGGGGGGGRGGAYDKRSPGAKKPWENRERGPRREYSDSRGGSGGGGSYRPNDRGGERRPYDRKPDGDRGGRPYAGKSYGSSSGGGAGGGFKKPWENREGRGERKSYGERKPYGEGKPYSGGGDRKPYAGGGERRPYAGGGDRKPYAGGGERRPYAGGGDRKPYAGGGERRPYAGGGDRKPYAGGGERKPYAGGGERRPYAGGGDRKPYAGGGERRPYAGGGDRKPYAGGGERKSYGDRGGRGGAGGSEGRPAYRPSANREGGDRRSFSRPWEKREGGGGYAGNRDRGARPERPFERKDRDSPPRSQLGDRREREQRGPKSRPWEKNE